MREPHAHYFPEHDAPEMEPFRLAFFHMMFAHAEFERRVSQLRAAIAGDEQLADQRLPDAKDRPNEIIKLIGNHHPGGLPQADDIVNCLSRSITLCHDRNLLAHGHWWELTQAGITVRSDRDRADQERFKTFTADEIERIASTLDDLESELYKRQRAIEQARGD